MWKQSINISQAIQMDWIPLQLRLLHLHHCIRGNIQTLLISQCKMEQIRITQITFSIAIKTNNPLKFHYQVNHYSNKVCINNQLSIQTFNNSISIILICSNNNKIFHHHYSKYIRISDQKDRIIEEMLDELYKNHRETCKFIYHDRNLQLYLNY